MRWFKKRPKPAPLLSDAEMAKLNEEIFEEPLSIERLFAIYDARPTTNWPIEWVMDKHMANRIRKICMDGISAFSPPPLDVDNPEVRLIGLPIAIEPFAKLGIRERVRR